ncbi:glycosyltransferase family 4 protein [Halobacillus mangrovi]|uniref:glycosyltransferase family 4 protein n=1 Tax=Halobacillus mangrovi TaxID=402384 RepID=UPI003D9814E4
MKVLYIATSFPEPNKGATIYTDLAETIKEAGHDITVAVAEQARNKKNTELNIERGIEVLRVVTGNYYDVSLIEKGVTTLKIPVLMKKGIAKYLGEKEFDFILFEAPPVTNAAVVSWAKSKFNCEAYLMLKDIFPQNAVDLGIMKKNSLLYKYFEGKEKKLYRTADKVGCMSPANQKYILSHNPWLDQKKVEIFPNTKKLTTDIKSNGFPMRKQLGIPDDSVVFLFGGNMGKPQYIEVLCKTIKECRDEQDIFFLFVGRGTDRYKLEETIEDYDIKNALLIENLPREEYEQITKECDVGLIVLDPGFTIPNYPSRILSYLEYAKPVLAVTDKVTDLRDLIESCKCGEWVWSGESDQVIKKVKEISKRNDLETMGENGRSYVLDNLKVEKSLQILENHYY